MDRKLVNAVGGISTRACDSCIRKRATWYCPADDAFLCQSCDSSVHSPNPMARRHQRVRLKMGSLRSSMSTPLWHQGFTRKSRTPRQKKVNNSAGTTVNNSSHLVPEIGDSPRENDEQILHRVPDFDSLLDAEFGQEIDLAEFKSFLGKGMEDAWLELEGLGLPECDEIKEDTESIERAVKIEENHEDTKPVVVEQMQTQELDCRKNYIYDLKKISLRLDYNGVISAWDDHKSPWTTGERPDLNSFGECWPYCLGTCGGMHVMDGCGGREARVMRYREKRRTRLFSKKIRYQVRKLNADKRPRIKGRFVKTPILMLQQ